MNQPLRKFKPAPGQWSLKNRLVLGVVILGALGITGSDFAAQNAFRTFLIAQVDAQLEAISTTSGIRLDRAGITSEREETNNSNEPLFQPFEPIREVPSEISISLLDRDGVVMGTLGGAQSPQQVQNVISGLSVTELQSKAGKPFTIEGNDRNRSEYRVLARILPGEIGSVLTAVSLDGVEKSINQLRFLFFAVGIVVLFFLAFIARRIIGISLKPLTQVEETAEAFAKGDYTARLPEARGDTEVGKLTWALNQMLSRIEESFEARKASEDKLRRFVADASHELRRRIEQESIRMSTLVEDLLLLARLDQSREMERSPIDLKTLINEAVTSAKVAGPNHPIEVDLPSDDVFVLGDSMRIHQVVSNLLANARTHTPIGTKIRLKLEEGERGVSIEVSDNGPGLSKEDQARIFERFYRADPSRVRNGGEGTGLGLSIVDAVMRAHGGTVSVTSEVGHGATFKLFFPIQDL
ncbi:MAG: sensor histidine kinase [Actinobacteria bacterium]|nr:sensor histidine kinase [Actinomycetota bacterium]